MGTKQKLKKIMKINAVLICAGLIMGLTFFAFTVTAKTNYKTLAFDKKIETKQDFAKGKFKDIKLEEKAGGVEASLLSDESGEYISPVIQAPFKATHIGLHWKEQLADGALIAAYIRTSGDGENFSEWIKTTADRDGGKDGIKEDETFAALVGIAKADFAQAKIKFIPGKEISPKLKALTFTFINSAEESKQTTKKLSFIPRSVAESVGISKTSPNGQAISVIPREEWGADEKYRENANGNEDWPRSYHGTRKIIIHHTAGSASNGETSLETNKATVRAIYYYHAVTRNWGDIGYNALVDASGNIYEGRYGTHDVMTRSNPAADQIMVLDMEGAHAASYNSGSFGVSAMGDFTDFEIPTDQWDGLKKVLAFVADSRGIDVQGNSDFLRYDGIWYEDLNNVIAHRDVGATACPGDKLYAKMTAIKSEVDNLPGMLSNLHGFSATLNSTPISGTSVGLGAINFSWEEFSDAAQYQYAMEKVFGTIYDPQPWETAWMNETNTRIISSSAISIETGNLDPLSQYVFYVRALDANEKPISTISHVNFKTEDTVAPEIWITTPAEGYEAAERERLAVSVEASDNVAVAKIEIFFDGKLKTACDNATSCSTIIQMRKESAGWHGIEAKAFDAAGNSESATVNFTKAGSTPDDPEEPKPEKCTPWPSCKKN
ncbi:MAG: N-acetylmuramoyl-L-alanine amidase [Patescibacteria group bacterium]|nr:N-acetylmuramoyl-L-alanine amidase [Patescibacteria group bacterium]